MVIGALKHMQSILSKAEFKYFFIVSSIVAAGVVFVGVVVLTYAGVIAPWSGRYVHIMKLLNTFIATKSTCH